ncbi:hypothetical protein DSO57_1002548 [Entomophthora muscae]|uniref:Uncharacterized protein n=1 Tax=Entomophthora muscae TaxID=34485 RepID=A0ACC2T8P0_9FUNG|nr:hypothetical protein DSO57_1002548 [Entomophthora muscae]
MKGILFLLRLLVLLFTVVLGIEPPTPTTDWHISSPDDSQQKESLANEWFKYLSGHWGRKLHYGCTTNPSPPVELLLVRPYTSFYLLMYVLEYYLLGCFSSMMGRFAYLGHLGHLAMVTVPIGLVIAGLNIGALAHQIGNLFPLRWVPGRFLQLLLYFILLTQRSYDPPANLPAMYCLPGAPFGPVHFTEYLLKPKYKDYTTDNILAWDLLDRTK